MELFNPNKIFRSKTLWSALATLSALGGAHLMRKGLESSWRAIRKEEPPQNPASPSTEWGEAIIWTITIGVFAGMARLVARRLMASAWEEVADEQPPFEAE